MTKEQFSARLRQLRDARKLTQLQVSSGAQIYLTLYECYENPKYSRVPTYKNLIKLADFFGCSVDYLLCQTGNPIRNS